MVNKLSVPIEANYKYARGVAVYGDIKTVQMIMVKLSKSIETKNVIYRDVIVLDYDEINDLKQLLKQSALSCMVLAHKLPHRTEQANAV